MQVQPAWQKIRFAVAALASIVAMALFYVLFSTPDYAPGNTLQQLPVWYTAQGETALPVTYPKVAGETHRITATLPTLAPADCLVFRTENLSVTVSVEGVTLYATPVVLPHQTIGDEWHLVYLPLGYAGKTVAIDSTVLFADGSNYIRSVYVGSRADFLREMLSRKLASFMVSWLIVLVGVVYLITSWPVNRMLGVRTPVSLAVLFIILGLWSVMQTEVPELLYGNTPLFHLLTYATLPFAAAMISFFLNTLPAPRWLKPTYRWIGYAQLALGTLAIAGETLRFAAYVETLPQVRYSMILLLLLFLCQLPKLLKQYQTHCYLLLGLACLAVTIFTDIVSVYLGSYDYGRNTRFGLFWLTLLLSLQYWLQMRESFKLADEAEVMRRLAYKDTLTGLSNRLALVSDQEALLARREGCVGIVQLDINNLKQVNDTDGHEEGDALILRAASAIQQAFGDYGTCYRIGGDEFVVLITRDACQETCQTCADRLNEACTLQNQNQRHPLSIAFGFALYQPAMGDQFYDLVRVADMRMYQQKRKMKAQESGLPVSDKPEDTEPHQTADDTDGASAFPYAGIPQPPASEPAACPLCAKPGKRKRKPTRA